MVTRYSVGQSRRASDAMIPDDMIPDNEARRICIAMGNNPNCRKAKLLVVINVFCGLYFV